MRIPTVLWMLLWTTLLAKVDAAGLIVVGCNETVTVSSHHEYLVEGCHNWTYPIDWLDNNNTVTRFTQTTQCAEPLENVSITVRRCNALPFIQLGSTCNCLGLPTSTFANAVSLHISDIAGGNLTYPYAHGRAAPWQQVALIELYAGCSMPNVSVAFENVSITLWTGSLDVLYPSDYDHNALVSPMFSMSLNDKWEAISLVAAQSHMIIHQSVRSQFDVTNVVFQFLLAGQGQSLMSLRVTIIASAIEFYVTVNGDSAVTNDTEVISSAVYIFVGASNVQLGSSSAGGIPSSVLRIEGSSTIVVQSHVLDVLQQDISLTASAIFIGSPFATPTYNASVRGLLINISAGCSMNITGSNNVAAVILEKLRLSDVTKGGVIMIYPLNSVPPKIFGGGGTQLRGYAIMGVHYYGGYTPPCWNMPFFAKNLAGKRKKSPWASHAEFRSRS